MHKIGGWFLAKHDALVGEEVLWSHYANRTQSTNRAVGGKLFLTNQRLLFNPQLLDYATGGAKWSVELDNIQQVDKQLRGGDHLGGGLRDRLRITLQGGEVELFVVNDLDGVIALLQSSLPSGE